LLILATSRSKNKNHLRNNGLPKGGGLRNNFAVDTKTYWKQRQQTFEKALDSAIPKANLQPPTLHKAMRYSLFAGGKRLRPILCLAAAESVGGRPPTAMPLACALECVHTYSLIHDDLPCMDDDDLRRGMPTSHKVFGEGIAVLAGDALLTYAFQLAAQAKPSKRYNAAHYVTELSIGSGNQGMIAGQIVDLEGEGKKVTPKQLKYIHENKTAALITSSIRLGAMSANATEKQLATLTQFGKSLGLAFQVIDDILDITQTSEQLGKSAGKDLKAQKATYPAILGLDKAQAEAARLTKLAKDTIRSMGSKAAPLQAIAEYLLSRQN
jgi:geranylgeranyl diphosphate synthase type II